MFGLRVVFSSAALTFAIMSISGEIYLHPLVTGFALFAGISSGYTIIHDFGKRRS